jgi:hypothetical protein
MLFSGVLLWLFWPAETATLEGLIPEDILALAVLTNPPENLYFLAETELANWINESSKDLDFGLMQPTLKNAASIFNREVLRLWLIVHGAESRGRENWRVNLTGLLVPRDPESRALEQEVDRVVREMFGPGTIEVADHEEVRVYRGERPGQVLYQIRTPSYLMLSNSREGWQEILQTSLGRRKSLDENIAFQKVRSQLPAREGLFLYVRASRFFSLLPEFGYSLRWGPEGVQEEYVEVRAGDSENEP